VVVDASVGRAAGDKTASHPTSLACRKTLQAIFAKKHFAVFDRRLLEEWKKQRSNYARGWQRQMTSHGRIVRTLGTQSEAVDGCILASDDESGREAMSKDVHLVNAALQTGAVVLSLDESAERLFRNLATMCDMLCPMQWAHPVSDHEHVYGWLSAGAPQLPAWRFC